jgi:hypothetical protein
MDQHNPTTTAHHTIIQDPTTTQDRITIPEDTTMIHTNSNPMDQATITTEIRDKATTAEETQQLLTAAHVWEHFAVLAVCLIAV